MYECKYPHLFSSIQLGNTVFRNRIFSSPTGVWYCDPEHRPIPETMAYYERKAKGGAASINIGESIVCDYDSGDSRYAPIGFVSEEDILGRVILRILPLNRIGVVR